MRKVFNFTAYFFAIWFFLSFIEIVLKNCNPDPVYSALNFFILVLK